MGGRRQTVRTEEGKRETGIERAQTKMERERLKVGKKGSESDGD